jgi:hypothetical protein
MNDLATRQHPQSPAFSQSSTLTVELAKMLALVAPTSMSTEQQELWLRAALDTMIDIRPDEVAAVSLEVRRKVTRPAQIVPEIANLVAQRRTEARKMSEYSSFPPPPAQKEPEPYKPFTDEEIERMPKWLRDTGLRSGFLVRVGNRIVDSATVE